MKVDNVTFVEVAVKGMTKEEFINAHIKVCLLYTSPSPRDCS